MKIAVSGKRGIGKAFPILSKAFAKASYSVLAIDADSNLALTFGSPYPESITPLSGTADLIIEERTGARPRQAVPYFKLNPRKVIKSR